MGYWEDLDLPDCGHLYMGCRSYHDLGAQCNEHQPDYEITNPINGVGYVWESGILEVYYVATCA